MCDRILTIFRDDFPKRGSDGCMTAGRIRKQMHKRRNEYMNIHNISEYNKSS